MEDAKESSSAGESMPPSFMPENIDRSEGAPPVDPEDLRDDRELVEEIEHRSRLRSLVETVGIIAAALLVSVIIKTFFLQAFYVPSGSMETTLMPNDRIAVNRLADGVDDIHRGDIVVFVDPGEWLTDVEKSGPAWKERIGNLFQAIGIMPEDAGKHLVKRVIGVGGDTVTCCTAAGNVTVNGVELHETYLDDTTAPSHVEFDVTVPDGHLWVMGDNRDNSRDSRYHLDSPSQGFVPVDNVVGRAWAIFYPFSRFGTIPSGTSVFADVP